jgi:hypothetical protein
MKTQHLSTDTPAKSKEERIDKELQDSFPTSDPPSYSPGSTGAPAERKSEPLTSAHPSVRGAAKKVKSGAAYKPDAY